MDPSIMFAVGLLIVGMILFMIEAMIPSFGAIGIIGAVSMIGSFVMAFRISPVIGTIFLIVGPVGSILLFFMGLKLLPKTKMGRSFILNGPASEKEQTVETGFQGLEGKEGVAKTVLRPSGIAIIDNERVTVQTEGERVEKDSRIKVVKVVGNKIFVDKV
jgi:membrane-bound serine protease (ClpP class)